ncbi:MAG: DUF5618 family protein [Candidatus Hydrothermales bacterium]
MREFKINLEELENLKKEASRCYKKVNETLKKSQIDEELNLYEDEEYVKEAYGALWLAILKALDYALLDTGKITKKDLPESSDEYGYYINRYLLHKDVKLKKQFENLYDEIYIGGYYRGLKRRKDIINSDFKATKEFIQKLGIKLED